MFSGLSRPPFEPPRRSNSGEFHFKCENNKTTFETEKRVVFLMFILYSSIFFINIINLQFYSLWYIRPSYNQHLIT